MSCNLTDAEWKLMHRLWEQSPQTITQLTAALSAETGRPVPVEGVDDFSQHPTPGAAS